MRRALILLAVALAGVVTAVWIFQSGSDAPTTARPVEPVAEGASPTDEAGGATSEEPVASDPSQRSSAVSPDGSPDDDPDDDPCGTCYDGVNLLEDRTADEIDRVQAWSDEDYTAAVEGLWAMHDGDQLDFAQARRADQALLVDRLLGTDISESTRAALLDLHSQAQATMAGSEKTPGLAPGVTRAMTAYEDGAAELLTDEQLDRLLNGRPVGD